jgi:micrococcal nuclease
VLPLRSGGTRADRVDARRRTLTANPRFGSRRGAERLLAIVIVLGVVAAVVVVVGLLVDQPPAVPAADSGPASPLQGRMATVIRVVDGDTIVVEIDGRTERVRYIGVDAPELANAESGSPADCGADAATEANRDLVAGRQLVLETDVTDRDRFGRLLRHPWLDQGGARLVTELLVARGALEARSYPPDELHDDRLAAAERSARAEGAGLWGTC